MKRPLKLSLAIALALGATDARAGSGPIRSGQASTSRWWPKFRSSRVRRRAEASSSSASAMISTASASTAPASACRYGSLWRRTRAAGRWCITSQDIVRRPFLNLLLEANWPKGRLPREYAVLLDPPIMAPAVKGSVRCSGRRRTRARACAGAPGEQTGRRAEAGCRPGTGQAGAPLRHRQRPRRLPRPVKYGPVAAGGRSAVARATRARRGVSVNQMMLALLEAPINGFYRDNINALKRGAVCAFEREEIGAVGSVRRRRPRCAPRSEWRGARRFRRPSSPTSRPPRAPGRRRRPARPRHRRASVLHSCRREGKAGDSAADRPVAALPAGWRRRHPRRTRARTRSADQPRAGIRRAEVAGQGPGRHQGQERAPDLAAEQRTGGTAREAEGAAGRQGRAGRGNARTGGSVARDGGHGQHRHAGNLRPPPLPPRPARRLQRRSPRKTSGATATTLPRRPPRRPPTPPPPRRPRRPSRRRHPSRSTRRLRWVIVRGCGRHGRTGGRRTGRGKRAGRAAACVDPGTCAETGSGQAGTADPGDDARAGRGDAVVSRAVGIGRRRHRRRAAPAARPARPAQAQDARGHQQPSVDRRPLR